MARTTGKRSNKSYGKAHGEKSSSTDMLKGTPYQQAGPHQGKIIKSIVKADYKSKRIVHFTDGTRVATNKVAIRAAIDVELDRRIRPKMEDTLVKHRDGTASVKIGGEVEGEVRDYKSVRGAEAAIQRRYSGDFDFYKKMRAEGKKRCNSSPKKTEPVPMKKPLKKKKG